MNNRSHLIIKILFLVTSVFLGVAFFAWTVFPYSQIIRFFKSDEKVIQTGDASFITNNKKLFSPYTSVQTGLRDGFMEMSYTRAQAGQIDPRGELYVLALSKYEESLLHADGYANNYVRLGLAYDTLALSAATKEDIIANYQKAASYYESALKLAPYYVPAIKLYSNNLYNQGLGEVSIALLKDTIKQEDRILVFHYLLGYYQSQLSENYYAEALTEMEIALDGSYAADPAATREVYLKFQKYFTKQKDVERLEVVNERLGF